MDERMEIRLEADLADQVRDSARRFGVSQSEFIRESARAYTFARPVYSLDGLSRHSLVRDAWAVRHPIDSGNVAEAQERLNAHRSYVDGLSQKFTTATTSNASQIVPPGYQPLIADITSDTPLWEAATRGQLSDATPFTVPGDVTETSIGSGVAPSTEGVAATDGTLTFAGKTVTPHGITGRFVVTREIADSSNPVIDSVALNVMRADWGRQVESEIFAELNTTQSGTITAGQVPSGAQARTSAAAALPSDLRKAIVNFVDFRKARVRSVVTTSRSSVTDQLDGLDMQAFALRDVTIGISPWITGVAAGDGDVFGVASGDLWAWSSPLLNFSYFEKSGPALVELALFGYFATKVIKPVGIFSIRHT